MRTREQGKTSKQHDGSVLSVPYVVSHRSRLEKQKRPGSLAWREGRWRERGRASASPPEPVVNSLRVKMHHGMGVSAGDRRCGQNTAMQPRNGVCDKIENYISELGQWYVNKEESRVQENPFEGNWTLFHPCTGYTAPTARGRDSPE